MAMPYSFAFACTPSAIDAAGGVAAFTELAAAELTKEFREIGWPPDSSDVMPELPAAAFAFRLEPRSVVLLTLKQPDDAMANGLHQWVGVFMSMPDYDAMSDEQRTALRLIHRCAAERLVALDAIESVDCTLPPDDVERLRAERR